MAAISGIDIESGNAELFGFVLDHGLELAKAPAMESAPHLPTRLDSLADVGKVLQYDDSCSLSNCLLDDLFADFVVNLPNMAHLFTRDFLQQLFCRLRTVGLQSAPFGKIFASFMADLASAKEFSAACGSKDVFSDVYSEEGCFVGKRNIGKVKNEVEVPSSLSEDKFGLLVEALREIVLLKRPHAHGDSDAFPEGVKGKGIAPDGVGTLIEMDAAVCVEADGGNGLFFRDGSIFVSPAHRENGVADHLRAQKRRGTDFFVDEMVEGDAVPAPMLNYRRNNLVARSQVGFAQSQKFLALLICHFKTYADGAFHWLKRMVFANFIFNLKNGAALPPSPKGLGFRAVVG